MRLWRTKRFLVAFCARMLASAHSLSENGAPAAASSLSQKGAIDCEPGAEVGTFKRAL